VDGVDTGHVGEEAEINRDELVYERFVPLTHLHAMTIILCVDEQ